MAKLFVEPITKTIGEWQMPLGDGVGFFKGLTEAALGFFKSPADGFKGLIAPALDAGSLKSMEPSQAAYLLIYQSLKLATYMLLEENREWLGPRKPDSKPIGEQFDEHLQHIRLTIDANFFKSTHQIPFWNGVKDLLAQWLIEVFAVPEEKARGLSNRLPYYFEISLDEEWSRYPDSYQIIKDKLETPLTPMAARAKAWLNYLKCLQDEITRPILGEDFGLEKIYVPLRGYYEREISGKEDDQVLPYSPTDKRYRRVVVALAKSLDEWLAQNNHKDALRVISGEPGCGKSSFARMFASGQASLGERRVLFIPLRDFDATADLERGLQDFIARGRIFGDHPMPFQLREEPLLIIFDALDELELRGKAWEEISRQFVDRIEDTLIAWNRDKCCLIY